MLRLMDDESGVDLLGDFVATMANAQESAAPEAGEAPYGYTTDRLTGERRPKKSPGRPRSSVPLEDLKASVAAAPIDGAEDAAADPGPPADRAPGPQPRRRGGRGGRVIRASSAPQSEAPPYRPGVITAGVNHLYRQAGKIIRAMDPDIGTAVLEAARNTAEPGEPDDSVGAAWDQLARTNPRVRAFVMKALAGGAVGQLVMAHAPIALAIMLKPAILRLIPFAKVVESLAEPDESTPPGAGGLPGGLDMADFEQMRALAEQQARAMGMNLPPDVVASMAAQAAQMTNGLFAVPVDPVSRETAPPPAFVRRQQRRATGRKRA
jgi:hypothetical protein